jgi:hypothetical protein
MVLVQVLEDNFYGMKKLDQPSVLVPVQVLVRYTSRSIINHGLTG